MIEFLGIKIGYEVLAFFVLFAASEAIALTPLKENSVIQVVQRLLGGLKVVRGEDDVVKAVRGQLEKVLDEIRALEK